MSLLDRIHGDDHENARNIEALEPCQKHMNAIPVDTMVYRSVDYEEELKL
ncbi:MAG: hypothetical protein LM589_05075 [Thermosphaera sp.]|nr:hypothetical protein [Thermosphaera sp.]